MTEEMKKACYESYLGDFYYEWGTYKGAMTYEEFCKECEEFGWDFIKNHIIEKLLKKGVDKSLNP